MEDRAAPRSIDADDSDVEVKSDDERLVLSPIILSFFLFLFYKFGLIVQIILDVYTSKKVSK